MTLIEKLAALEPRDEREPWQWGRYGDGWRLYDERCRVRADVWANGTWHTWDEDGVGGENARADHVSLAKGEASAAVLRQGWCASMTGEKLAALEPRDEKRREAPLRHAVKESGDCAHWCRRCRYVRERGLPLDSELPDTAKEE